MHSYNKLDKEINFTLEYTHEGTKVQIRMSTLYAGMGS